MISTLLYGSETWTTYAIQERNLNSFHLRCLRRILQIPRRDNIRNTEVLERSQMTSMFAILTERRLRRLGHVSRMQCGRIPKDILYGELTTGSRPLGRPRLRYKDIYKRDLTLYNIGFHSWETSAADRQLWKQAVRSGVHTTEVSRTANARQKRAWRKGLNIQPRQPTTFTCSTCNRDCHSRIGLCTHSRRCT